MNARQQAPYVVGLTGGVGSGKSTVCALFASHGIYTVDVDDISHALTAPGGSAIAEIATAFPGVVSDDILDRAALRSLVFSDAAKRKRLESIMHPMIRDRTLQALQSDVAHTSAYSVLVVPLLFESSAYTSFIQCAIVVDVPVYVQIERIVNTRQLPREVAQGIIAAQMPRETRLAKAQFVINNTGTRESLTHQVTSLHQTLTSNAIASRGISHIEAFA